MEKTRILILGATGYIGGSVFSELLRTTDKPFEISALVRKDEQVDKLKTLGAHGILFESLDDHDVIVAAAAQHDVVVAAASARHAGSAKSCIEGLSLRQKTTGKAVHYIHTSGASFLGDWPESGGRVDTSFHSDVEEDIYALEKNFPEDFSPVRKVDLTVIESGIKYGVTTYIIPPPLIFGRGTGPFTEGTGQVHQMVQLALKKNQAVMVGSGSGIWSRVNISDLSNLYLLLVHKALEGKHVPSGKLGYYFAENGSQTWKSIAEGIGNMGKRSGVFKTSKIGDIELKEVGDEFYGGDLRDAEAVLASNARMKADRARQILGWKPTRAAEAFEEEIKDVFVLMSKTKSS